METPCISSSTWKKIFREKVLKPMNLWKAPEKGKTIPQIRSYTLRHTRATEILNREHDLFLLANILGHATLESTKPYLHKDQSYMGYMRKILDR